MKVKKYIWICRQLNYQIKISGISILLEIILNAFKCLTVSLSTEIHFLSTAPLSLISASILCELAMLPDVYILLSPQVEEVYSSYWWGMCTHLEEHSSKRLNPLSVIILVCLGNIKKQDCETNCFFLGPPSVDVW